MVGEMNTLVEFLRDSITDIVTYLPWRVTRLMFAIACVGVAAASIVMLLDGPVPTAAGNGRWWLIASALVGSVSLIGAIWDWLRDARHRRAATWCAACGLVAVIPPVLWVLS